MSKDTFYFSHDYNARQDPKVKRLLSKHGMIGYGIFWSIIEDLYNNANALPTDYDSIAFDLRSDKKMIESIITEFDLFVFEGDNFGSLSVQKRLEERNSKSIKAKQSALKRWAKDATALQPQSDSNAIKESKGKESKENDITVYRQFAHLSISVGQVTKLTNEGYNIEEIDDILNRIQNFKKNKNYVDLYLTALVWLKKDRKDKSVKSEKKMVI